MWFFAARAANAAIFAESPPVSGSPSPPPPPPALPAPPLPFCPAATGNNLSMHLRLSLRKFCKKKKTGGNDGIGLDRHVKIRIAHAVSFIRDI